MIKFLTTWSTSLLNDYITFVCLAGSIWISFSVPEIGAYLFVGWRIPGAYLDPVLWTSAPHFCQQANDSATQQASQARKPKPAPRGQPASQPTRSSQQAGQQARTRRPLSNFKPPDTATSWHFLLFFFDFRSFYWAFELIWSPWTRLHLLYFHCFPWIFKGF